MKQILHSMKLFLPWMAFGGRFLRLDHKQGSVAATQRRAGGGGRVGRKTLPKVSPCSKKTFFLFIYLIFFGWIKY